VRAVDAELREAWEWVCGRTVRAVGPPRVYVPSPEGLHRDWERWNRPLVIGAGRPGVAVGQRQLPGNSAATRQL